MFTEIKDTLSVPEKEEILRMWNQEYPADIFLKDLLALDIYLASLHNPVHYLLKNGPDKIAAWATAFERTSEQWFAIVIDRAYQGNGMGSLLMKLLQKTYTQLNGWIVNEQGLYRIDGGLYKAPLHFYEKHGFYILPETKLSTGKISLVKIRWNRDLSAEK